MNEKKGKRITITDLNRMKKNGEVFAALSLYRSSDARLFDEAGGHVIVVGDSANMTFAGNRSTVSATMDEMLIYARAVRNGTKRLFVIGDMPLGSYEVCETSAVENALRFIKADCNAVKVETNMAYVERIRAIANACLVVAHIGLNPNKAEFLGGYRTLGKDQESINNLLETAAAVENAGACMILVESVVEETTQQILKAVKIPVFGVAAGRKLHGQLVIGDDLSGHYKWEGIEPPRHFETYRALPTDNGCSIGEITRNAYTWYVNQVTKGLFPGEENLHRIPSLSADASSTSK